MDTDGNARKRRRRNAIRPNSLEAQAIREIADDYRNRVAVEAVENLRIADGCSESVVSADSSSPPPVASAVATSIQSSSPGTALSAPASLYSPALIATVVNVFQGVDDDDVPLAECHRDSDDTDPGSPTGEIPSNDDDVIVATAVRIDDTIVSAEGVHLIEGGEGSDESEG